MLAALDRSKRNRIDHQPRLEAGVDRELSAYLVEHLAHTRKVKGQALEPLICAIRSLKRIVNAAFIFVPERDGGGKALAKLVELQRIQQRSARRFDRDNDA